MWIRRTCIRRLASLMTWAALVALASVSVAWATSDVDIEVVSPLHNKDSGKSETPIGDLMADAVCAVLSTDVAFVASSELKPLDEPIPAGANTTAPLAQVVSYTDDSLTVMELPGKTIRAALERSVSIYPQPSMAFLQVSGVKFTFDPAASPGERVVVLTIDGKTVSDETRYKVGLTTSLASGALGYWKVWAANDPRTRVPDMTLIKAMRTHLKSNPKVNYAKLDRISAVQK